MLVVGKTVFLLCFVYSRICCMLSLVSSCTSPDSLVSPEAVMFDGELY